MQAVILAAGEGTRMRPLTLSKPKVLIEVAGKPFLYFLLKNIEKANIKDVIIVAGYKKEMISAFLKEYHFNAKIIEQTERLGTGHAVSLLKDMISEDFILLYGDNIYSSKDIEAIKKQDEFCYASCMENNNPEEYGVFIEKNGLLEKIIEKPKEPVGNLINIGLYKFTKDIFSALSKIQKSTRDEYELTDAVSILAQERKVKTNHISDYWIDFGSLEDIPIAEQKINALTDELQMEYYFEDMDACPIKEAFIGIQYPWEALQKKDELISIDKQELNGDIHSSVIINGPVRIGAGTVIEPFVFIEGPVIIGENCHIRSFSRIRPTTIIGNNCTIGNGTEIKNSIVFDEAKAQSHSFVGDSILGKGSRIASGVIIGNRRLDQKIITFYVHDKPFLSNKDKMGCVVGDYARLGTNCSTTPGTLIGKYSWIYSNMLIRSFVPKNSLMKLRQATEIVSLNSVKLSHLDKEGKI